MKKKIRCLLFSILFFVLQQTSFASHIVGGDISVQYLSPNTYQVTFTFFRDCGSTTGYESTVYLGVYDKVTNARQQVITLSSPSIITLTLGDACYVPNLCIQKAVYIGTVSIPNNPNGYYISWLRCCRNNVITNIVNPGNEGYVFYTEIANPAIINSSPVFNSVPNGYICKNYLNLANFSATDADGDVLVYSFSTPLSCNPTGQCSSINPAPSGSAVNLPGPHGGITWQAGYSLASPMGDPAMSISSGGVISITPPNLGVFVISVKVSEYRGGVKIGEIQRDFQYEVMNCTVLNTSILPGNPICASTSTTITATGASAGSTYVWSPGGQTTAAINLVPTASGTYNYTVTATNGPCSSASSVALVVNSNPTPVVTSTGNICLGQNISLTASGGTTYSWNNGSTGSVLTGVANGTYTATITNASGCSGTATGIITQAVPPTSTYTWTGGGISTSNNWFDSNNWGNSGGCIPTCGIDVFIPNTAGLPLTNPPKIDIALGSAACRNITIANGNTLIFSSATAELDVCGDFIQNGSVNMSAGGVLKFTGTIAQSFTKSSTATLDLNHVILANTASPLPTLTVKEGTGYQDLSVSSSGTFTFQSGMLVTEGDRNLLIKNTSSSALSGHGVSSYVYGKIDRYIAAGTSYQFPVGGAPVTGNSYPYELLKIDFTSLSGGMNDLTVSFSNPPNSTGTGLPVVENAPITGQYDILLDNGGSNTGVGATGSIGGLWTLMPNTGSAVYDLTLYGRNYDNPGAFEHSILSRNEFCPASWALKGSYTSSSVSGNVVTAYRTGLSGFSQKGIAKALTALPVSLVLFDASCANHKTVLSWVTASESNNKYFTLERSCNENYFQYQAIATIPGAGNSNTLHEYSYTDKDEVAGECYFRLSQTDYNGIVTEFVPVAINCNENAAFNLVGVAPNPAETEMHVFFTSSKENEVALTVTDIVGKELYTKKISAEIGLNQVDLNVSQYTSGVYFVNINNGTKSFVKKVVKKD